MDEEKKFLGIMGLIALRKSELYNLVISELENKQSLTNLKKTEVKEIIAKMDNKIFLSKPEVLNKKIVKSFSVKDIYPDISPILKEIELKLKKT